MFSLNELYIIALALTLFTLSVGLMKGKNWARIITIFFSILNIISGLTMVVMESILAFFGVIIGLIVAGYLLFSNSAKSFFVHK